MRKIVILIVSLFVSLFSVGQKKYTRGEYILMYKDIAIKEMIAFKIPASITLAQGILESNNGNSTLAVKANNHFGIKCHKNWKGKRIYHDDDRPNECFRKYKVAEDSYIDHSKFLHKHKRYAFLFEYDITDYKSWAKGLKKAGYATHPKYDKILIRIIEENKLYKLDNSTKVKRNKPKQKTEVKKDLLLADDVDNYAINPFDNDIKTYNRINYIVVRDGDTFESVAKRYDMRTWQLYKYNELSRDARLIPGDRLYLQPKRRKAPIGSDYHTIKPGENMYSISQKYGIKIKRLYKINNIEYGSEPDIGYTLSLRKKKK
jgi:LysM repeat protein